jgi:hypothetical protein
MNKKELEKLAIKRLNSKEVQAIKKQVCNQFTDKKNKQDCKIAFDKNFIKSYINTYKKYM